MLTKEYFAIFIESDTLYVHLFLTFFVNHLVFFIELTELCNFADDNSIYECGDNITNVIASLEHDLCIILQWFASNQLVANPAKFQMMVLGYPNFENIFIDLPNCKLKPSKSVKLLGITIDCKLSFNTHIVSLCKRANSGIKCLSRVRKFLTLSQAKLLFNSYIISQFNYCPIFWMFCNNTSYSAIVL